MELSKLALDPKKETEGVWFDLDDTCSFKIARINNPAYRKELVVALKPYARQINAGTFTAEKSDEIHCKIWARTVIVDWKGLEVDGKDWPYSHENCYELLTNSSYNALRTELLSFAEQEASYRADEIGQAVKNSKASSSGS